MEKSKIILADDHQIIIDGISNLLLKMEDVEVVSKVSDGIELMRKAELFNPDLIITDIEMPRLNGIEATMEIRKKNPHVKIIILSMHKDPVLIKKLIKLGIEGYLTKTVDEEEFISAVKMVLKGQRYFSGEVTTALTEEYFESVDHKKDIEKIALLSEREIEIIKLICEGLSNKQIAEKLFISFRTVDTHRSNIMRKLEVNNVIQLIRISMKNGIIES